MISTLLAGLLAGYGVAIPVGAVGAYLVALTARTSLRVGLGAALGIATVDGGYALAAVLGGAALSRLLQPIATPARWAGAAIMLALAVHAALAALRRYRRHTDTGVPGPGRDTTGPLRAFGTFVGITALNPVTVVYFTALVLGGSAAVMATPWHAAMFVLAAFAASMSWQALLASGGALLGRLVSGHRGRLVTALVSSVVMVALAAQLLAH